MYVKKGCKFIPDDFTYEQSLVIDTFAGLVIFSSRSYGGVDNIIKEIFEIFGGKKIHAIFGGFHLFESSTDDIKGLADRIKQTEIEEIYTGHCTGKEAFAIMKEIMGEQLVLIHSGMEIE